MRSFFFFVFFGRIGTGADSFLKALSRCFFFGEGGVFFCFFVHEHLPFF